MNPGKAMPRFSRRPMRRAGASGFTMIELLMTVAILGILSVAAIPSFRTFIAEQRIKTASFDLISMLTMARSEAIKRGANVTIAMSSSFFTVTSPDGTILLKQEVPAGVTFTGGSTVIYNSSGRLSAAFTPLQLSSTASTSVRCISIDLSGRPNSKKAAC